MMPDSTAQSGELLTTSAFFSRTVSRMPGTLMGSKIPAVMPEMPAPMTAT